MHMHQRRCSVPTRCRPGMPLCAGQCVPLVERNSCITKTGAPRWHLRTLEMNQRPRTLCAWRLHRFGARQGTERCHCAERHGITRHVTGSRQMRIRRPTRKLTDGSCTSPRSVSLIPLGVRLPVKCGIAAGGAAERALDDRPPGVLHPCHATVADWATASLPHDRRLQSFTGASPRQL